MQLNLQTLWGRRAIGCAALLLCVVALLQPERLPGASPLNLLLPPLDPTKPPGANFDLSHWYLGTPDLPVSDSIEAARLIAGYTNTWFYTGPDGAMVFWAPVTGGTTPNSTFPRSELREQINPPDDTINWGPAGTHIMDAQCKVTVLPSTGKVIIGQIHSYLDDARPLLKLMYDNGVIDAQLKRSPTADTDVHYTFASVAFNSLITYRIVYTDGMLTMTINGVTQTANVFANDAGWASQEHYFKAGAYVQDNSGVSSEIGRVEFYQLSASHSTPPRAPIIVKQPTSLGTQQKNDVVLNLSAIGGLPMSYQWWKNGAPVPNATNSILPIYNAQLADSGGYFAVVTNISGMATSAVGVLTVVTNTDPPSLAEALDAPNLGWTTNGTPAWIGNFGVAHDGRDAARSPVTGNSQSPSFQSTVAGPGLLTFWWKISSETNGDYLIFATNGVEQARISGEIDWRQRTLTIGPGTQVLRWTYSKNASLTGGQDRALVDEVQFQPLPVVITTQPASQAVDVGTTVQFDVAAAGTPPFSYQWRFNGIDLANKGSVRGATTASLMLSNVTGLQQGSYSVVVSNGTGRITSSNALLVVNAVVPLDEALDATNLVWVTNGAAPWTGRPFGSHDGVDAAQTKPITNGQSAALQTTVTGPGVITFWWKVSSETNADNLIFDIGGAEQARISGESDWQQRIFAVATGSRVLRWTYAKNASGMAGLDSAWLDEVRFAPQPPIITAQPLSRIVDANTVVTFNVTNTGTPPFSYQWRWNETDLVDGNGVRGAQTASLTLSNVQPTQAGDYSVVIGNATASVTSSNAQLIVNSILSLAEALDATNLVWTTTGTPPWEGRTGVAHDGRDAAASGAIADGVTASFQATVTGPGTVSFWWKVSSEPGNDRVMFLINGTELDRLSGEFDWERRSFPVPSGTQTISWSYRKNSSISQGLDRAWVDEVSYEQFRPPPAPLTLTATAVSMSQINLAWSDDSTNETAFRLERSTNGTTFTQIALLASNVTNFANTGLVGGLTFYYRISATNVAGTSAYSPQAVASTPWFTIAKINFQPASAPVPDGYVADAGLVYGDRSNGLVYGWNSSRSSSTVDRNSALSPDQRYDTYVSAGTSTSRTWDLLVPNGTYNVLLVAGDADSSSDTYRFSLEGQVALDGTASSSNRWVTARTTTVVSDGQLTLGNLSGVTDNKLCFVEISKPGPLLICQPDKMAEYGAPWTFDAPFQTTNACSGTNNVISLLGTVTNRSGSCGATFIATRTWRAVDICGNTNVCSQTVSVIDTTAPVLASAGDKLFEAGNPWSFDVPTASDAAGGGPVTLTVTGTTTNRANSCGQGFVATRTWIATDACGNSATATQTISIVDTMLPTLLCAPSRTVEAGTGWIFDPPAPPADLGDGTDVALLVIGTVTNKENFCTGSFMATRTWRAVDACGNSSTCSQIITVVDTTPTPMVCGTNKTVTAGSLWKFDSPVLTPDNGAGTNITFVLVNTVTNRDGFCLGTFAVTRTWRVIDPCGNSNQCAQTLTVQDRTAPTLACATNRTVEAGSSWNFDLPVMTGEAGDETNVTMVVVSTLTNRAGFCGGSFAVTRTWRATDPCGNGNGCSQVVTVVDTQPPTLSCANNKVVEAGGAWNFDPPVVTGDAGSGTNVTVVLVSTLTNQSGFCPGSFSVTRTWLSADACGNGRTCSQMVTVRDTVPPTILCATNKTVEAGSSWSFDLPTAAADAGSSTNVLVALVNTATNVGSLCDRTYTVTRTWSALDSCGNSNICSQVVTLVDRTAPLLSCAGNKTVEAGTDWNFDPPSAPPENGTNATLLLVSTITNRGSFCNGSYRATRTWSAVDACGNSNTCSQTVTVADTTPPILLCATNKTVEAGGAWTFDAPPAPADGGDGTNVTLILVSTVTNLGNFCDRSTTISRTWRAVDACGNSNSCSQTVTMIDTEPPALRCAMSQTVEFGSSWDFAQPTAEDLADGSNVTITIVSTLTNVLCGNTFAATRFWSARDHCDNSNTCSQTVTVVDTTPPVLIAPLSQMVECGVAWTFGTPDATDISGGTNVTLRIVSTVVDAIEGGAFAFTRTWMAVDRCGNSNGCKQVITVRDTAPPTLLCQDTNSTDSCLSLSLQASDRCDPAPQVICTRQDGQPLDARFPLGTTMVTCTATDRSSNSAICDFNVTISARPGIDSGVQFACATSNVTIYATAPWTAPSSYVWTFEGTVIPDAVASALTLTNVSEGNAGRYCVAITGPCETVTNCVTLVVTNCQPTELCSLTQGFFGTSGAQWNGQLAPMVLANLLSNGTLVLGSPGTRSLFILAGDLPLLIARLPARGPASALPDGGDQLIANQPINNKGRFQNSLLGETIALLLNDRLDDTLGGLALRNQFCTANNEGTRIFEIPPPVLEALADRALNITNVTVAGLIKLAHAALAGRPTGGASLSDIASAVATINQAFDQCRFAVACNAASALLPPNDAFANRLLITNAPVQNVITISGWNVGATPEPGEPAHNGLAPTKSVWWQWTPTESGWVSLHTFGSSFDTRVAVYTGDSLRDLVEVADDDDKNNQLAAATVFFANAGTEYKIVVDGYIGDSGNIVLTITAGITP